MSLDTRKRERDAFHPVDQFFAQKIAPQAPKNVALFLAYLLKMAREGHLCISTENLSDPHLLEGARTLPQELFYEYLVREGSRIYLRRNWECENRFLKHLKRLQTQKPSPEISAEWLQGRLVNQPLNEEQKNAIFKVCSHSLTLISGGPGTGKTHTAAALIRLLLEKQVSISIAAPTGKAAANMRALAGQCRVQTLHALLRTNRLDADVVIVDEASMVDAEKMAELFSAIKEGGRLVLIGDKDQLPPVESGNFFAEVATESDWVATLKTSLRTDLQEIIQMAEKVKRGEMIPCYPLPALKNLIPLLMQKQTNILTPLRRGLFGSEHLNHLLFLEHQKKGVHEIPIMVTINDPHLELFNGDTGVLNLKERRAYFPGGRSFPEYLLPRWETAYVLSVHKSQGSEYKRVLILLPEGSEMFGREMLYTAITRAKEAVEIYAASGMLDAVLNNRFIRLSGINHIVDST